jgi:hypothetical protein
MLPRWRVTGTLNPVVGPPMAITPAAPVPIPNGAPMPVAAAPAPAQQAQAPGQAASSPAALAPAPSVWMPPPKPWEPLGTSMEKKIQCLLTYAFATM